MIVSYIINFFELNPSTDRSEEYQGKKDKRKRNKKINKLIKLKLK